MVKKKRIQRGGDLRDGYKFNDPKPLKLPDPIKIGTLEIPVKTTNCTELQGVSHGGYRNLKRRRSKRRVKRTTKKRKKRRRKSRKKKSTKKRRRRRR